MKILVIDGYNLLHRARSGFTKGDFAIIYNFFRQFRAQVELHKPSRVYFVLEGEPLRQLCIDNDYKANRQVEEGTREHVKLVDFHKQKHTIIEMLKTWFPVSVIRHEAYEADDVIYNLIKKSSTSVPWTVVSSDTDFIQLLQEFDHVNLYNPIKKEYVSPPDYDYVTWKALRGDACDNIKGIPGIGDKTATRLVTEDIDKLSMLKDDAEKGAIFFRNYEMIKLHQMIDEELNEITCSQPVCDWDTIQAAFDEMGFKSMTKKKYWERFMDTFDSLWETR